MECRDHPVNRPDELSRIVHKHLGRRAYELAEQALRCLEELSGLYPADLPEEVVVAVRRFHDHLPGEPAAPFGQERRRAPRFPAGGKLTLTDPQAPDQASEVVAVDRSCGGFSFLSGRPLAVGSVVVVADVTVPGASPPLRAEIKSCRPEGEAWVVGCELLPSP